MNQEFFEYDNNINRKIKILGTNMSEVSILVVGVFGAVLLGGVLSTLGVPSTPYFLFVLLLFVAGIIALRRINKKDHPSFLLSFLSYRLFQPKKIKMLSMKLQFKEKKS
jgi:F0F1-type ATP synthase assembly protein I